MIKIGSEIKGVILFTGIFLFVLILDIGAVCVYYFRAVSFIGSQPVNPCGDAAVVFFGDYIKNGSALGTDSKNRAGKAVALYSEKKIRKVICVGGYNYRYWRGKPHLMKDYLIEHQVPAIDILYDSASFNTITNWQEAQKIITRFNFDTVINISSPLHIYRISDMIDIPNIYYATYSYELESLHDYWVLYKDIHHEFLSRILNRILKDEIRNKIVLIYSFLENQFDKIF
jgi:vancomycin permeability regulator SanA